MSKPGDLFVGATDFFSVLLPGVALTFVLLWRFGDLLGLALLGEKTWQAAAFLTVAYILGHFVDLIGAVALDRIYDLTYAGWLRHRKGDPLGKEAERLAGDAMLPNDNKYQWCRLWIQIYSPSSYLEIERLQANSKLFRGIVVVACITFFLVRTDTQVDLAMEGKWVCAALACFGFYRFSNLRWKAVQQAYRVYIALRSESGGAAAKAAAASVRFGNE